MDTAASQMLQSDCKRIIHTLGGISNSELSNYLENEEKIITLIQDLDPSYLKNLENDKSELLASVQQLSEDNLVNDPVLENGRSELVLLSQQGEELSNRVKEAQKTLREKGGDMNLETALSLLQNAASDAETTSEDVANNFMNNEKDLDTFLDEFLEKRKLMHLRLVKVDKLKKLIDQESMIGGNYVNAPPLNLNSQYFPSMPPVNPPVVPYPTADFNMPMPGGNYFQNHY